MQKYIAAAILIGLTITSASPATAAPNADAPGLAIAAEHMPVCPPGKSDTARCHARVVVDKHGKPQPIAPSAGFSPAQLRSAYNLTGEGSQSQIIAIVDAYDHPSIQSDLDTYSDKFGIPRLPACTVAIALSPVPCFQKVDQNGGTDYPVVNAGWALEIALDVEVAHAICQKCSILLVEATNNGLDNLGLAVNKAVELGATVVSNSYGTQGEFAGETTYDQFYNHPGVAITVSTGDAGYGVSYPAASPYVTAVGGTSLTLNANGTYNKEVAWTGGGSGCSAYEAVKPAGQAVLAGCAKRIVADVAAVADPNTGAAVYNSVPYNGSVGWSKVGGTSLSAPLIAGIYALSGGVPAGVQGNSLPYAQKNSSNMRDITSGSNGNCPKNTSALCTAVRGFDGPTGLGTPNGIGAF